MRKRIAIALLLAAPGLCLAEAGDESVVEMFQCELKEGKKMEEVEANNKKWLVMTRKHAGSDEVNSYALNPMVGDLTKFIFVDAYPSMAAWSAAKDAGDTDESKAIEAAFNELMDCTKNRLYKAKQH